MKKTLILSTIILGLSASINSNAATGWGDGCGTPHAEVTYTYAGDDTIFAIINGYACMVTDITGTAEMATAVSILTSAQTSGRPANLSFYENYITASMN